MYINYVRPILRTISKKENPNCSEQLGFFYYNKIVDIKHFKFYTNLVNCSEQLIQIYIFIFI
jgi:hypothetical protein